MKISTIKEAEAQLQRYVPNVAAYSGDDQTLDRMWPLLAAVGNPHEKLRAIHIAGTSGKTSTSYYIASLLASSGKKVGLTVSPHVDSITERVQINGNPLSEVEFTQQLGVFLDLISAVQPEPSYFELMIVFVLWEFVNQKVEYAVLETGMGGLFDGTNVVTRADKVCVITDIGFDHMHVLGNTIQQIAKQKAGIMHAGNEAMMLMQDEVIVGVMCDRANSVGAHIVVIEPEYDLNLNIPLFQKRNWFLAQRACEFVARRDNFVLNQNFTPEHLIVPARMEIIKLNDGSELVIDGAHNGQKMQAFVSSFREKYPNEQVTALVALKEGKEYSDVLPPLAQITDSMICTTFNTSQDLPARSLAPEKLADAAKRKGITAVIQNDNSAAFKQLILSDKKIKIIVGSFYLISQLRDSINEYKNA